MIVKMDDSQSAVSPEDADKAAVIQQKSLILSRYSDPENQD